jgi:hypothetical protein
MFLALTLTGGEDAASAAGHENRDILASICGIITQKWHKNGQKRAKIGEFRLLIS